MKYFEFRTIPIQLLELNTGQLAPHVPANPRDWTRQDVIDLARSMVETPELAEIRMPIVVPYEDGHYIVLGGNMRREAALHNKETELLCAVLPENTTSQKMKEIALKDNSSFGKFNFEMLRKDWGEFEFQDIGIQFPELKMQFSTDKEEEDTEAIERKRREFEERMKAGEISEEDEEYQEFLEKFKLKKTTDDCYTPTLVYEAVADFVARKYNKKRSDFIRPFYPGGDYEKEIYPKGCVVVDNPPFSIMAQILKFYEAKKIDFFLFAPHLTLFSSSSSNSTALPCGVAVTYENGANVNTSFLTNLEPKHIRLRSEPELYQLIKKANDDTLAQTRKELPKYAYDHHVITSTFIGQLSRLGIDFMVPRSESVAVSRLDSQKGTDKAIYGKGYLVSDNVFAEREKAEREKAEREKAEREKAEREKAERWELSDRERALIAKLGAKQTE